MIVEFSRLLQIDFPRSDDQSLRKYLEQINTIGYNSKILEKDFYLTGLLGYLSHRLPELSFKGGTCLNKIHFPYFRLSEDLDFSMDLNDPLVDTNSKREKFADNMRSVMKDIAANMGWILSSDNKHHNKAQGNKYIRNKEYTYLKYEIIYNSLFGGTDTIKIECTYTHKQLLPSVYLPIQSIYKNLVFESSIFPATHIKCLDIAEMISEKTRAALTRQVPAIRDFYDLRYMTTKNIYILTDYISSIKEKCDDVDNRRTIATFTHVANGATYDTLDYLRQRVDPELSPVLVDTTFDLDNIYKQLLHVYNLLNE